MWAKASNCATCPAPTQAPIIAHRTHACSECGSPIYTSITGRQFWSCDCTNDSRILRFVGVHPNDTIQVLEWTQP